MRVMYVCFLLVALSFGCSPGYQEVEPLSASRNVEMRLQATDFVSSDDISSPIRWSVLSSPVSLPGGRFSKPDEENTEFTAFAEGRYELAMTFAQGQSEAVYRFEVQVGEGPSAISSQADYYAPVGASVPLSVTEIRIFDPDSLSFHWEIERAPLDSGLMGRRLEGDAQRTAEIVPDVLGRYDVKLVADDDGGAINTASFAVVATPTYQAWPEGSAQIAKQGSVLITRRLGSEQLRLTRESSGFVDISFASGIKSAELYRDGAIALVLSGTELHVVDTMLAEITQSITVGQNASLIDLSNDNRAFLDQNNAILVVDLTSETQAVFSMPNVRGLVYDSVQDAFYSNRSVFGETTLTKWEFGVGEMVEINSLTKASSSAGDLHISAERRELVTTEDGDVYSISADPQADLVKIGEFDLGNETMYQLHRPQNLDWSIALVRGPLTADRLVLYSNETFEALAQPLGQQLSVGGKAIAPFHRSLTSGWNSDEALLLSTATINSSPFTCLMRIPLRFE